MKVSQDNYPDRGINEGVVARILTVLTEDGETFADVSEKYDNNM
jgi:hypothetical protein